MVRVVEQIGEGATDGGLDKSKSGRGGILAKVASKTKRAVARVVLAGLPLLPIATGCALEPTGEDGEFCASVDADQRPLDNFFSNYDFRKIQPLSVEQRGKSLEKIKLSVDFLSDFFEERVALHAGQKISLKDIIEFEEKSIFFVPAQAIKSRIEVSFKQDVSAFLSHLQTIDPNAKIVSQSDQKISFNLNGVDYSLCRYMKDVMPEQGCDDVSGFSLFVGDKQYDWTRFNAMGNVEDGYVLESYVEDGDRISTTFDSTGNSIRAKRKDMRYYFDSEGNQYYYDDTGEKVPVDDNTKISAQDVETSYSIKVGERVPLESIQDLIQFIKGLDNGSLAMFVAQSYVAGFLEKLPKSEFNGALKSLISAFPSDNPEYIMMVWNQLLEANLLNERCSFLSPEEILEIRQSQRNRVGTVQDFAVFNALWSRLNGYKTTVHDLRYVPADGVGSASGYPVTATNPQTGEVFLLDKGVSEKFDSGETLKSIIDRYNKQLFVSGSGDRLELKDEISF